MFRTKNWKKGVQVGKDRQTLLRTSLNPGLFQSFASSCDYYDYCEDLLRILLQLQLLQLI